MPSYKYSFNAKDMEKIGTGAAIAVLGALLTFFAQVVTQVDFGQYTPFIVAISSVAINALRKFVNGEEE